MPEDEHGGRPVWFAISRIASFAKYPASGGTPAWARPPTSEDANVTGIALPQAAHPAQVLFLVHPVDHRPGRQEHQRLVERVGDEEEHRHAVGAHPAAMNMKPSWLIVE